VTGRRATPTDRELRFEPRSPQTLRWTLAGAGVAALVVAVIADRPQAHAAFDQVWSPFVLVAWLLLIGLVADDDGLFASAGHYLARTARSGPVLVAGAAVMVGAVTAVLNLDTGVAFLTPVLVYTAKSRGEGEARCCTAAFCWLTPGPYSFPARI
jgi:arsenical pump membrane protein